MKFPYVITDLTRWKELEEVEKKYNRLSKIVMMVEYAKRNSERYERQILFRMPLGDIPFSLSYAKDYHGMFRLFGLDLGTVMFESEGYDILFME